MSKDGNSKVGLVLPAEKAATLYHAIVRLAGGTDGALPSSAARMRLDQLVKLIEDDSVSKRYTDYMGGQTMMSAPEKKKAEHLEGWCDRVVGPNLCTVDFEPLSGEAKGVAFVNVDLISLGRMSGIKSKVSIDRK